MKRSDFLAFIPALSAIPLIGKEIVKKSDRIEIYQPDEVKNFVAPEKGRAYLAVIKDDVIVGTAYMTNLMVTQENYDITSRYDDGRKHTPGPFQCNLEATMMGPVTTDMMEALQDAFRKQ